MTGFRSSRPYYLARAPRTSWQRENDGKLLPMNQKGWALRFAPFICPTGRALLRGLAGFAAAITNAWRR